MLDAEDEWISGLMPLTYDSCRTPHGGHDVGEGLAPITNTSLKWDGPPVVAQDPIAQSWRDRRLALPGSEQFRGRHVREQQRWLAITLIAWLSTGLTPLVMRLRSPSGCRFALA